MNEKTIVKTVALPGGRPWEWYGDANVVALSPHLCPEGRERALEEVSAHWRRSCLRVVPDAAAFVPNVAAATVVHQTQPLAMLSPRQG